MFLNPLVLLFFSKYWGAKYIMPPQPNYWRGHGPPGPPIAPPMRYTTPFSIRGQKWICLRDLMIMMMMILLSTLHNIVCNLVCKPTHFHTLMMYIQYRLAYWLYGPPRIERVGNGNVRLSVSQSYSGPENSVQIRPQFSELLCCLL